jgi:hypothetical protein
MRRLASALAVTAGLTLLAGAARAQGKGDYPPPNRGGLTVSESTISPGDRFTVSGDGARPGASVSFTLQPTITALGKDRVVPAGSEPARPGNTSRPEPQPQVPLGSTTNADGRFSATLTVPPGTEPGSYTLTATSGGELLAAMTLRVMTVGGIGGLPFTGATVLPGLATGAALIVAGGVLLLSLKRRRPAV